METMWEKLVYGSNKGKSLILEILCRRFPLSAKKIYYEIKKRYGANLTYQAIHKSLKELVNQQIVVVNEREYMIDIVWLNKFEDHITNVKKKLLGEELITTQTNKIEKENSLKIIELYYQSIVNLTSDYNKYPFLSLKRYSLRNRSKNFNNVNLFEELEKNGKALLLGDAGDGKTTILNKIMCCFAKNKKKIPIFIKLKTLNELDIFKIINQTIIKYTKRGINETFLWMLLEEGSFIFLFDGLNEYEDLVGEKKKFNFYKKFREIITSVQFSKNYFVFTTRTHNYLSDLLEIPTYHIQPVPKNMIRTFIFQNSESVHYKEIKKNKNVLSLCKKPLFLKMLIEVYDKTNKPEKTHDLYETYIEYLIYDLHKNNIANDRYLILKYVYVILSSIAYKSKFEKSNIKISEIHSYVNQINLKEKHKTYIIDKIFSSGLLVRYSDVFCEFFHESFHDYFIARYFFDNYFKKGMNKTIVMKYIKDKRWHNSLVFLSGFLDDSTTLVKLTTSHDFSLAAKCINEAGYVDSDEKKVFLKKLVSMFEDNDYYEKWNKIMESIENFGDYSKKILSKCINHKNGKIARRSAYAIKNVKNCEELLLKALNNKDAHTRYHAVETITQIADISNLHLFIRFINDKDIIIKTAIIDVIKNLSQEYGEKILEILEKINLVKNKDLIEFIEDLDKESTKNLKVNLKSKINYVRAHSLIALARKENPNHINLILKYLKDSDELVRYHAIEALRIKGEIILPYIIPKIKSYDNLTKINIIRLLGRLQAQTSTEPYLNKFIETEKNPKIIYEIINSLYNIGSNEAIELISKLANHPTKMVWKTAKNVLRNRK